MNVVGFELNYNYRDDKGQLHERTSAVDYFRVVQPLLYLKKNTDWNIEIRRDPFINGDKNWKDITNKFDIIFSGYNIAKEAAYISIRVHGMRNNCNLVLDLDDNIWEIDESNPVYERLHPGTKDHDRVEAILKDVPHLICTQPFLLDRIVHYTKRIGSMTHSIGNSIDLDLYNPDPHVEDDKIVIVYSGSHTHFLDINFPPFVKAMHRILNEYKNVHFWAIGMMTNIFANYGERYRYIPGHSDFMEYIKLWKKEISMADIAVAPLHTSNFSKSKSSLKFLEYSAAKLPTITSNVYPYRRERNSDIIFAQNEEEWYKNLKDLVENEQKRKKIGENNYNYVKNKRNISKNWIKYKELFENIVKNMKD